MAVHLSPDGSVTTQTVEPNEMKPRGGGESPQQRRERQAWRLWLLVVGLILAVVVVVGRLLIYQVVQWGEIVPVGTGHVGGAPRGTIVDRNGILLAADRFYYSVAATSNALRSDDTRFEVATELENLIGLPANQTLSLLSSYPYSYYVELAKIVPLEQGERIEARKSELGQKFDAFPLQSVFITPSPRRYYPQGELGGRLLGFINLERRPFYGVEYYYDRFLDQSSSTGLTDKPQSTLDDLSPAIRTYLPSLAGKDLVLTLDSAIQWIVEDELRKGIQDYKAVRGTVIVMDPMTGEILAMSTLPTYDPNRYGDADTSSFLDPAISEQYEPGSVFKVITMGTGLDTGVITPTTVFNDKGVISIGGRTIFNSQEIGYGEVTTQIALARSLNVVTAQVALLIGRNAFYDYVRRFGFSQATEVDLAGEVPGAVKFPGTLDWSESDLGTNSFGQGLAVTPLQMINAVASIANGGRLMRPYIVKARVLGEQVLETEPTVVHTTMSPESAKQLTEMMVFTIEEGNKKARVLGYSAAGKSGTAQIPDKGGYLKDQVNHTFVGFLPADAPRVAIFVRLERPDQTIQPWASDTTSVMFSRLGRRIMDYLNVPPDSIRQAVAVTP